MLQCFPFLPQSEIVISLLERYTAVQASTAPVILLERSLAVAHQVFMPLYRHLCGQAEYKQLTSLAAWGHKHFEQGIPTLYLHCTPSIMTERLIFRRRPAEHRMRWFTAARVALINNYVALFTAYRISSGYRGRWTFGRPIDHSPISIRVICLPNRPQLQS